MARGLIRGVDFLRAMLFVPWPVVRSPVGPVAVGGLVKTWSAWPAVVADVLFPAQKTVAILVALAELFGQIRRVFFQFFARQLAVLVFIGGVEFLHRALLCLPSHIAATPLLIELGYHGLCRCKCRN